jgi:LmbE family N-acetylglucosaminyl deacetylase
MRVLMIVAHPDDEVVFGFRDLIQNQVCVVTLTNGDNKVRRSEFFESANAAGFVGHMLNYPDNPDDIWSNYSIEHFYENHIKNIIGSSKFELVVSHSSDGEYGNKQHIRTHEIGRFVASSLGLPFSTFRNRYRTSDYPTHKDKYTMLVSIYKSQKKAIENLADYFSQSRVLPSKNGKVVEGVIPDRRLLTKSFC